MKASSLLNSNRTGHLFAAAIAGAIIAPFFPVTGIGVFLWEWLATNDVDLMENRRPKRLPGMLWKWFWLPYAEAIPHRSQFSHSIVWGTTFKLGYVFAIIFLVGWALVGNEASAEFSRSLALAVWPSAAIADAVHLLKDGYKNPMHILFGR